MVKNGDRVRLSSTKGRDRDGVVTTVTGSLLRVPGPRLLRLLLPNGRWLVFRLEADGLFGLYKMHPDGSHKQAILPLSPFRPSLIDWGSRAGHD